MPNPLHANLTEIYAHAVACLEGLLTRVSTGTPSAAGFDAARAAMEALPLTTEEAAVARNHLNNVRSYTIAAERGAACYELRLLANGLTLLNADASGHRPLFRPGPGRPENDHD